MDRKRLSLAELQEVPKNSLMLLAGPPGAGKSTFCRQMVVNGIASERPVLFVTTEQSPSEVLGLLREKGMGEPVALSFVDAFAETVGLAARERPDTIGANCEDLNSISMAIAKQQDKIGKRDILLAFDSLTSPYLFNKEEVFRFMRLCLLKFTAEGNSVVATVDEGCGKEEDMVGMMSVADGILRMGIKEDSRIINVVKHPKLAPTRIETPMTWSPMLYLERLDPGIARRSIEAYFKARAGQPVRREVGDFVNVFWRNLARWSGMLWDPKRFPTMAYELDKEFEYRRVESSWQFIPWHVKLLAKIAFPRTFREVKDMKKAASPHVKTARELGMGLIEYLAEASRKDEHCIRLYENVSCWGLENVGARLDFCGEYAGLFQGFDKEKGDWNAVETKCIGTGSPYCEFKLVRGEISELKDTLEAIDSSVVEKIHDRLMGQLTGFLIHGRPLAERPKLGNRLYFQEVQFVTGLPALASERYRMALRMGGAKLGKEVGECLIEAGIRGNEAIRRVIDFMNHCRVGKVTLGETIRIQENCETFGLETGEPSCFFTTGFLNGLYSVVKNQHVREIKCVAAGDPFCEWEIT